MKILAIDLGLKRIGVAYSPLEGMVVPLEPIKRINRNQAAKAVDEVINEHEIDVVVFGIAIGGESEEEMRRRVEHFVRLLSTKAKVVYIDESFSSHEAKERTKNEFGKEGKLDSISAMIILERYLLREKSTR